MLMDCDDCGVRGDACGECAVTALLGNPPDSREWDETERAAVDVLADSGLVPRLRLVPVVGRWRSGHEPSPARVTGRRLYKTANG